MPKIETYRVTDFPEKDHLDSQQQTDALYMFDAHTNQGAFEFLKVETYDTAARRSTRLAGTALLAAARFHGFINTERRTGEIILQHHSESRRGAAFVASPQTKSHNNAQR